MSGPLDGGTMVTVRGDNLGTAHSDIIEVTIGGVSCDIIDDSYQRGIRYIIYMCMCNMYNVQNTSY